MKRLEQEKLRDSSIARIFPKSEIESRQPVSVIADLSTADQELDELRNVIEDLKLSLEQATKRINRLQGERSQLTKMLEKRDQQIQDLNRELGACADKDQRKRSTAVAGNSPFLELSKVLLSFKNGKLFNWFRRRDGKTVKSRLPNVEISQEKNGKAPLRAHLTKGEAKPVVVVLLLGLDESAMGWLLPTVEKECASQHTMPLFVVDSDAFELFRTRSMVFEYLPPAIDRDRFDSSLHWDLYLQRRLALIRRKWRPVRTIAFGKVATDILALWSSSPFETTHLPSVSGSLSKEFDQEDKNAARKTLQELNA